MADIKYIHFNKLNNTGKKTEMYEILSISRDALLGYIKWYGPWRQYCFFPECDTIFNKGCLNTINEFINKLMQERNNARRN